uniref:Uncharacterized protein n=1 Tax=Siphoviridae sp. ctmpG14 TaxID=2825654 RepID=A0A8S5PC87_9CAUD|nr:MAG TPA: hypothetical protein [Siphoviridae sp. ctmpG14]
MIRDFFLKLRCILTRRRLRRYLIWVLKVSIFMFGRAVVSRVLTYICDCS